MSRPPLNLRSFGIAGLGDVITDTLKPLNADGTCPPGYSKLFGKSCIKASSLVIPTNTITPYPKLTSGGQCPPGYVKKYSGMGGKGQEPPYTCVPAPATTTTTTAAPYSISPSLKPAPGTGVAAEVTTQGAPVSATGASAASAPFTADPIRWLPIALGGVGVLGLLFLLLRRR